MSASTTTPSTAPGRRPAAAPADYVPPRRLFAFLIMVFGMFMSILDIQIVSASLAEIQAGLSASSSEVSWVQTAYLIAEVIAIPLSGFLSRALGTRLLFAISAAGFTGDAKVSYAVHDTVVGTYTSTLTVSVAPAREAKND